MAKKQKFYVVWKGREPGVYTSWADCDAQVKGFSGAQFKSFETLIQAENAFQSQSPNLIASQPKLLESKPLVSKTIHVEEPIPESYVVDAACSSNPGDLEYQCVHTTSRSIIFKQGPFENGTNNIGEFLAIVHALALFKRKTIVSPIYSDSEVAINWIESKKCRTKLATTDTNKRLFELVARAETWLANNSYENKILKWQTNLWGENPADYGRK